jgi:hypothetical protein
LELPPVPADSPADPDAAIAEPAKVLSDPAELPGYSPAPEVVAAPEVIATPESEQRPEAPSGFPGIPLAIALAAVMITGAKLYGPRKPRTEYQERLA